MKIFLLPLAAVALCACVSQPVPPAELKVGRGPASTEIPVLNYKYSGNGDFSWGKRETALLKMDEFEQLTGAIEVYEHNLTRSAQLNVRLKFKEGLQDFDLKNCMATAWTADAKKELEGAHADFVKVEKEYVATLTLPGAQFGERLGYTLPAEVDLKLWCASFREDEHPVIKINFIRTAQQDL